MPIRLLLPWLLALGQSLVAQPARAPIPTWTLSAQPTLEIGDDANIQTQFNGVDGSTRDMVLSVGET